MKKIIAMLLCLAMALSLVACGGSSAPAATEAPKADAPATNAPTAEAPTAEPVTIKVAAIETAYGSQVWVDVAAAFEAETGIKVELTTDKNLEDVLSGPMQNGEFPDVVHLATGRPAGLTEQLVKANALHPLTNALALTIPGESVKVSDKIAGKTQEAADRYGLPLLAKMPIDPALAKLADAGRIEDFEGDWLDGAAARL